MSQTKTRNDLFFNPTVEQIATFPTDVPLKNYFHIILQYFGMFGIFLNIAVGWI